MGKITVPCRLVFCPNGLGQLDIQNTEVKVPSISTVNQVLREIMNNRELEKEFYSLYDFTYSKDDKYERGFLYQDVEVGSHYIFAFLPQTYSYSLYPDGSRRILDERYSTNDYLKVVLESTLYGRTGCQYELRVLDDRGCAVREYKKFTYYTVSDRMLDVAHFVLEEFPMERRIDLDTVRLNPLDEFIIEAEDVPEEKYPMLYHFVIVQPEVMEARYFTLKCLREIPQFAILLRILADQINEVDWMYFFKSIVMVPTSLVMSFEGLPIEIKNTKPNPLNFYYVIRPMRKISDVGLSRKRAVRRK
ncbi:unnamed protein product [Bursaphelenchus okinawaensis]|uniref:Uncharacterized protein n=1 Tax=Bursaphelenchus okinawaensis TaxID=465554 RepID=A0A811JQF7_9BILA|nr:unnamed protein product [Bursaphelenchus okinawaensis]CAG9077217.1 unnamed protein product [Bursaphelenchus okinawaensis]